MYNPIEVSQAASGALKMLENSGKVGRTDRWSIAWDGNLEGKVVVRPDETIAFAKVSNRVLAAADLVGSTITVHYDGQIDSGKLDAVDTLGDICVWDGGISGPAGTYDVEGMVLVIPESGTYFAYIEDAFYIASITKETIHPIDPKFLPGVCLPVVELTTVIDMDGTTISATNPDNALLHAARSSFCLIKFPFSYEGQTINLGIFAAPFNITVDESTAWGLSGDAAGVRFDFSTVEETWTVTTTAIASL